ncbi:MAG TPA: T9SS type A sorting domain-containing protein [Chitinophaga sp.]|uniref:Ig-like domain-containing protein n=1 Tax=Chitinophaga sp. TaxID=1869181 RepID=UPI002CE6A550|nr:T9SS type A sorting domain-containing protein [Chitinophaga sp.]HVI47965.1 T9SS type A sorting domain-containing protein [Chitinophaga sp.]
MLGTTVYQTLIFPTVSTIGCDSLIIGIGSSNALLSLNLFGGVTVQTFNGTTANNDAHVADSSSLRLLQSNTRAEIMLKPVNAFDRVKITLSSTLLGLLNSFHLYYAYRKPSVTTPVAADSFAVCSGDSIALTATGASNATIRWYDAASGGTFLATGQRYMVKPAATTTYYAEANAGGCKSIRKAVLVIVNPRPANPIYTVSQGVVCSNEIIRVTNYQPGINYNVKVKYLDFTGTVRDTSYLVNNSNTVVVVNNHTYGSQQVEVYIQAVDALTGCRSDSIHKTLIFGAAGKLPSVDADSLVICFDKSATLHAYIPLTDVPIISWYDAPTGGNLLHNGNYFTVKPAITTTYYAAASVTCEYPQRKPVKVIVTKLPDPDYVVPGGFLCGAVRKFPVLNHQTGINYNVRVKYTSSVNPNLLDTSFVVVNKDTITSVMQPQRYLMRGDIYVQAVNSLDSCKSDTVHQIFIIGASSVLPSVDADSVSICKGDSITLHAYVPDTNVPLIRWYNAPSAGNLLFTGNYYKVSPPITTTYYVTSAYVCDYPERKSVKVTVKNCPALVLLRSKNEGMLPDMTFKRLQIFPNPSHGNIWLAIGNNDITGSLVIIRDMNGREIQRETLRKSSLSFSKQIITGLYFIQVITVRKEIYSGKVFLQQ